MEAQKNPGSALGECNRECQSKHKQDTKNAGGSQAEELAPTAPPLLEISGQKIDEGNLVGMHPSDVPSEFLHGAFSAKNPVKAIRARCLDCCCGDASEIRKCVATDCASWPFRMGSNPFRKKPVLTDAERERRSALLTGGTADD